MRTGCVPRCVPNSDRKGHGKRHWERGLERIGTEWNAGNGKRRHSQRRNQRRTAWQIARALVWLVWFVWFVWFVCLVWQ